MQQLNQQHGISLISLMVGTALSMLTILTMLALFKNLIPVSIESTQNANHDGGLASALLLTQLELQSAGFGILGAGRDNFLVYPPSSTAILWRHKDLDSSNISCSGLLVRKHPTKTEREYRTLTLLQKPVCNVALRSLSVAESDDALKASWMAVTDTEPGSITNLVLLAPETDLTFEKADTTACRSYGIGNDDDHPQITITATNSSAVDALKVIYTVCLSNISQSD